MELLINNKINIAHLIIYLEDNVPSIEFLENIFFYGSMYPNEKSYIQAAEILCAYIDPSKNNQYLLKYCAMRGWEDGMNLLLRDKRTNALNLKDDLLFYARKFGNTEIINILNLLYIE